jgi:hypothetical protein
MYLKPYLLLLFSCSLVITNAQTFSARVLDTKTKEPIPYATVATGLNQGLITNEDGEFTFLLENVSHPQDSIFISYMGYETKGVLFSKTENLEILMTPKTYELNEVFLSTRTLDVDDIIDNVKERLNKNYAVGLTKKKIFFRQSEMGTMKKLDFGFEKSNIVELNKKLIDSITRIIPNKSSYYKETAADLYGNYENYKLNIKKAAELYDKNTDISAEGIGKKLEKIFNDNIKKDSYIKIKSGIFSTKMEVDSILRENEDAKIKVEKRKAEGDSNFHQQIENQIAYLYEQLFFSEDSKIDVIDKSNRYNFSLENYTVINGMSVYIIPFSPKGGKEFKGTLYVNTLDFAIVRLDFENVKPISNFGLLGISYSNDVFKGKMLFDKDKNGNYSPKYIELSDGGSMGLERPLKVIEKNKYVKGRRKQNELSLNLNIQGSQLMKYEFVVFESEAIHQSYFDKIEEYKVVKATYLSQYDPTFWINHTIIEPNQAIETFKVVE